MESLWPGTLRWRPRWLIHMWKRQRENLVQWQSKQHREKWKNTGMRSSWGSLLLSPDPLVGWGGDTPPLTSPHRRRRRLHSRAFGIRLSASIVFPHYKLYNRGAAGCARVQCLFVSCIGLRVVSLWNGLPAAIIISN